MARGRMIEVTCKCGGIFRIVGSIDDVKVTLKCADCGAEKSARRDKVPDTVEDISADVAAVIAAAATTNEEVIDEAPEAETIVEETNDNLEEVAVD